jgi:hypothetical protein
MEDIFMLWKEGKNLIGSIANACAEVAVVRKKSCPVVDHGRLVCELIGLVL